jgi:copper(I)-binding protein
MTIDGFSSPGFARAEMHETTITDGIARMQALESIDIEAGSNIEFAPGGMHVMLVEPLKAVLPGASIRLELRYNDGGLLLMDAPVMTRLDDPT